MKIGLAIYHFNPKKGGAERYTYDLSQMLARRGHEVCVFCADGVETPGITLVPLKTLSWPRWLRSLSFARRHRNEVGSFGCDVILGFGNTFELDVYQSHGGVQRIWMEREIASYDNPIERAFKACLLKNSLNQRIQRHIEEYGIRQGRCSRIIAISDMIKRHMVEYYGLSEELIDVVYNGVDTERFRPASVEPDGPLKILFCAGNFRLKGLSPLLTALGEIIKTTKDFQLLIMGRGRKKRYNEMINRLGLSDRVTFLGETSSPEEVYRQAHVLAHPTFYDACSLTTMEAMASGIPVITTAWNGASALVGADEGYIIDEPRNTPALTQAISAMFDGNRRRAMGERARSKMEQFTIARNTDGIEKILTEVAHGRP